MCTKRLNQAEINDPALERQLKATALLLFTPLCLLTVLIGSKYRHLAESAQNHQLLVTIRSANLETQHLKGVKSRSTRELHV